jgi:hypothetical protein
LNKASVAEESAGEVDMTDSLPEAVHESVTHTRSFTGCATVGSAVSLRYNKASVAEESAGEVDRWIADSANLPVLTVRGHLPIICSITET